jgi:hypothetical protein
MPRVSFAPETTSNRQCEPDRQGNVHTAMASHSMPQVLQSRQVLQLPRALRLPSRSFARCGCFGAGCSASVGAGVAVSAGAGAQAARIILAIIKIEITYNTCFRILSSLKVSGFACLNSVIHLLTYKINSLIGTTPPPERILTTNKPPSHGSRFMNFCIPR